MSDVPEVTPPAAPTAAELLAWAKTRGVRQRPAIIAVAAPIVAEPAAPEEVAEPAPPAELAGGFFPYLSQFQRPQEGRIEVAAELLPVTSTPEDLKRALSLTEREEKVSAGEQRLRAALGEINLSDPEEVAILRRRNERLNEELEDAYREVAALRKLTAGVGRTPGKRYYENMGQGIELDADELLDLLSEYEGEIPDALASHLKQMSRNLSQFALGCVAYAQTLD